MSEAETITGVLERIIFYNDENYFMVGEVRISSGLRENVVVSGTLPAVQCGETLELTGAWTNNKNYGRQFKVFSFKSKLPSSIHGLKKYLGSGLIHGIGKAYAEKIVNHFGADTLRVISEESARLREIRGIGAERVKAIKKSWDSQTALREIIIFLQTYGITSAQCTRITKEYGDDAKKRVMENPYSLANDIHGIAFATADKIARNIGFPNESDRRIDAGIFYTLRDAEKTGGHTALPAGELAERAAAMLEVAAELVEKRIKSLRAEKLLKSVRENAAEIVARKNAGAFRNNEVLGELAVHNKLSRHNDGDGGAGGDSNELLQNARQARAEFDIAESVAKLLAGESALPPIKIDAAVAWAQNNAGFEFAPEQAHAVATALAEKFSIITGGPGTGKTTILRALCSILRAKKVRITLAAPTGRAAQRMSESAGVPAGTIHRILKPNSQGSDFRHNENFPLETDFVVVDEASMLDNMLAAALLRAVPPEAHVMLVGDVNQLPSVGAGNVLGDLIASRLVPVTTLTAVFRQGKRSGIVAAAHAILHGDARVPGPRQLSVYEFDPARDIHFIESSSDVDCVKKVVELATKAIPRLLGISSCDDIQVLAPKRSGEVGIQNLNAVLQKAFGGDNGDGGRNFGANKGVTATGGISLRVGDKVLQNRNNYDKNVFNGDLGRVESLDTENGGVRVRFGDELVEYERGDLSELQLAYAITIHKSQGSEFPVVIIPLVKAHYVMLRRNLVYTAITRGRRKVFVVGDPVAYALGVKNADSSRRTTGLGALLAATTGSVAD